MAQVALQKVGGGVAVASPPAEAPAIWRFSTADFTRHGAWLIPRLVKALGLPEQRVAGWLSSMTDIPACLFLSSAHAVGLAEVYRAGMGLDPTVVRERFVLAESPKYIDEAAAFYVEFARWARSQALDTIFVEELTDVPHDTIKETLGRIFTRQQSFVRL